MEWGSVAPYLICPYCNNTLAQADSRLVCPRGHAFDIAREGYVNLLPSSRRVPKHVGDSRAMLHARRVFLDQGHYCPLSDAVNAVVVSHLSTRIQGAIPTAPLRTLDIGGGEGYYLGRFHAVARRAWHADQVSSIGVDVSKDAMRMAASRYHTCRFAVADIWSRLPFADASMTLLLNIFAPRNAAEFRRVIRADGLLIVVTPMANHLLEVRDTYPLLGIESGKREHLLARFAGLFACVDEVTLAYEVSLDQTALTALIAMTPSARHRIDERQEDRIALPRVQSQVGFRILAFRPVG